MSPRARAKKTPRARTVPVEVQTPAIVIDANYLQGIALSVRNAIREGLLPSILEQCIEQAQRGQMGMVVTPDEFRSDLASLTICEALQPELHRLGMKTEIVRQQIPRLGMTEERTALVISWRNAA